MRNLLSWVHPGFSVFAETAVDAAASSLKSQARYITRPALAMDALEKLDDGRLTLETPPHLRTGATTITPDPLEWIHRITTHIPDPRRHCQRFYRVYSNRRRVVTARPEGNRTKAAADSRADQENSESSREPRTTWALLMIQKIFQTDSLACSCGARMRILSSITDPRVVHHILPHLNSERCKANGPFESRVPPHGVPPALQ